MRSVRSPEATMFHCSSQSVRRLMSMIASLIALFTATGLYAFDADVPLLTSGMFPANESHHSEADASVTLTQYPGDLQYPGGAPYQESDVPYYLDDSYESLDGDSYETGNTRLGILPDYFDFFRGLDASKGPQDFGVNGLFGLRLSANATWILDDLSGLGWQLGTSLNYSENGLQFTEQVTGSKRRLQNFSTIGLFQRAESGFLWGAAFDLLYQDYYDNFFLGQWRANIGLSVTEDDDLGVWLAIPQFSDRGYYGSTPVKLTPIQQINFYWRRMWQSNVVTTGWIGWAQAHNDVNYLYGTTGSKDAEFVYGGDFHAPLNDRLAIYGQGNFIRPIDSGTLDASIGIVLYLGADANDAPFRRNAPIFPVANNPVFGVDLSR